MLLGAKLRSDKITKRLRPHRYITNNAWLFITSILAACGTCVIDEEGANVTNSGVLTPIHFPDFTKCEKINQINVASVIQESEISDDDVNQPEDEDKKTTRESEVTDDDTDQPEDQGKRTTRKAEVADEDTDQPEDQGKKTTQESEPAEGNTDTPSIDKPSSVIPLTSILSIDTHEVKPIEIKEGETNIAEMYKHEDIMKLESGGGEIEQGDNSIKFTLNGGQLTYTISGGDDADLFKIFTNKEGGGIKFKEAPDFENPKDKDKDNKYDFTLTVSISGLSPSDYNLSVNIIDIQGELDPTPADIV